MLNIIETRINGNEVRNTAFEGMLAEAILEAFATKVNKETPLEALRTEVLKVLNANGSKVCELAKNIKALEQGVAGDLRNITSVTENISVALEEQKQLKEKLMEIKAVNVNSYEKKRRVVEATKLLKEGDVLIAALFARKRSLQGRVDAMKKEKAVLVRSLKGLNLVKKQYKKALADDVELIRLAA